MSKNTQLGNLVNGIYVDSTGKVGVGTTSPLAKLHVYGTETSPSLTSNTGIFTVNSTSTVQLNIGGNNTAPYPIWLQTRDTSGGSNVYPLLLNPLGGNVGIGTSSPAAALHINGSALPMVVASTSATDLYCEYRYNTSTVLGYIGNGTGIVLSGGSSSDFGIRAQSNLIFTSGGGTERMRITSGGNIGIGESNPAAYWSAANKVVIYKAGGENGMTFVGDTNHTATIAFAYGITGADRYRGYIQFYHSNNNMYFGNSGTDRMIIAGSGNILMGTSTDNGYKLNVSGNIYASSNIYAVGGIGAQGNIYTDYGYGFGLNSNTQVAANGWNFYVSSSFSNYLRFFYGGTGVGSGSAKFQIDTGGGYTGLSDVNKKKDISLSTLGLAEIMQLKPSTFKFKDDEKQEEQIGFIAQEVKDIIPQAYYEDAEGDDKFIGLKQTAFIPVLVKAIQELKAEIDILKNK